MIACVNAGDRQNPKLLKDFRLETVCATIRLDGTQNPKAIDTSFTSGAQKSVTTKGIYKLEGNRLTICRTHFSDHPRPTKFESRELTFVVLIVWERIPAKSP